MTRRWIGLVLGLVVLATTAEDCDRQTTDGKQRDAQEQLLQEGTAQTGMPSIINFRERKLLKMILEMRDQAALPTYTYTFSEMTGQYKFFCDSIGYPIPYATQYTNPQKVDRWSTVLAQADPNGLFSPASAEGTWIMCKVPGKDAVSPVYVEPRVIASPFKLP